MRSRDDTTYSFVFRALLTEEALDQTIPSRQVDRQSDGGEFLLGIDSLDERYVSDARRMAHVYTMIAAFENSVRELVSSTLREQAGEEWWSSCVSEKIRTQAQQRMDE